MDTADSRVEDRVPAAEITRPTGRKAREADAVVVAPDRVKAGVAVAVRDKATAQVVHAAKIVSTH
jgi:hypothetical protein